MAQPSRPRAGWIPEGARRPAIAQGRSLSVAARWALRLGVVAAAGSWLGFYLITGLPFLDLESFRATAVLHGVTALVFIPYLASLIFTRRLPGGSVLDAPLLALLGVYLLTTATSLDWRVSLEVALIATMAVGVFYVLSDGRLLQRWQLEAAFMLAVLAAASWALWKVGNDYLDWLRLTEAVRGSVGLGDLVPPTVPKVHDVGDHPNLLGAIFAMSLPFFLAGMLRKLPAVLRVAIALAGAAVSVALFFALARSAWLGAATGLAVTAVLLAATPAGIERARGLLRTARARWAAGALGLALVAAIVAGAVLVATSVETRPLWLFRESGAPRLDVMEAGGGMVQDHPLLGTGPGVYGLLYPEYSGKHPNHAFHSHNGYLQTAVDMGVPGVLAMFALAGALGWLLWHGLRDTEGDARVSIAAAAGALAAFGVFSLLDAPNGFKGPLVALAAVGAIAVLGYREGRRESAFEAAAVLSWAPAARVAQTAARVVVPVAMAGLLITWGRLDAAHYFYSSGVREANAGQWEEAIDDAQRAVDLDPEFAAYRLALGTVQGQAFLTTRDPALLSDAVRQLDRAVTLEPRSAIGHANLALLLTETADRDATRDEALAALEFANSDPAVVLAAATALERAGWDGDAIEAYKQALFLDVNLVDSPFWNETPFRGEHFGEIVGQSALVFNPCTLLRLAMAEVPAGPLTRDEALSRCREHLFYHPDDQSARVTLAGALLADGAYDESFAHLDAVLDREPDYGPGRTTLGRWHAAQGQTEDARREWLRAGQLDEVEALVLLGDSYPAGEAPAEVVDRLRSELRGATSQVQFHLTGILYYRFKFFRGSPNTILLPGDWQHAVPARYAEAQEALARWTRR